MPRTIAATAFLVLLLSGASRADEYASLMRDCQHPATDPDKAIRACPPLAEAQGIEPVERAFLYDNLAVAYQIKGDDTNAIATFDKALKAYPDLWQARAGRARSEIGKLDLEAAVADFDLLSKMDTTASDKVQLPQGIRYYSEHGNTAPDGTTTKMPSQTPQDTIARLRSLLARTLAQRCMARAFNRAYDSALADCNQALGYEPNLAPAMALRGYVKFQTGDLAAALQDSDAAIARDGKASAPLFLRGVVKHKTGDIKGGDADIAAARAIDPEIEKKMAVNGIKP
jgi:tetratricopeptide (TPR) repeat protein